MGDARIGISMANDTDELLRDLLAGLDKSQLRELTVDRELETSVGLAGEPITVGAVIAGGTVVVSALLRLLERSLEHNQQRWMVKVVAENFDRQPELGSLLAKISEKYADVSIKFGIAKEAWPKRIDPTS